MFDMTSFPASELPTQQRSYHTGTQVHGMSKHTGVTVELPLYCVVQVK